MKLTTYIETIGDEAAAKQFGVKKRRIESWRANGTSRRYPRRQIAEQIVKVTNGIVTMDGIYNDNNS